MNRNRRNNVIIHGITAMKDDDVMTTVLDMCQVMGSIIFASDIVDVTRLGSYDVPTPKPPPVRVTFEYTYQRNNMLRRKANLMNHERFAQIFVSPDEPIEMRRIRGLFRKVAYRARAAGKEVVVRTEWIKIDDVTYQASEIDRIPSEFKPEILNRQNTKMSKDDDETVVDTTGARPKVRVRTDVVGDTDTTPQAVPKRMSPEPSVKIKLTKSGLTFSGPTAFPSNLHRTDFVFEGKPYTSSEQGYQYLNAEHHNVMDIAAKILATSDTKLIKEISHDIPKSEEWNKIAPSKLWALMDARFSQNPPLMDQLLDTAPHKLIEASIDEKWGGGVPHMDHKLMNLA